MHRCMDCGLLALCCISCLPRLSALKLLQTRCWQSHVSPALHCSLIEVLPTLQTAKQQGAKVLTGGCKHPGFSSGYYIAPTVFTDVSLDSQIWQEEVCPGGLG